MTPSELLRIMARLGCTRELVGVSDRAVRMYVAGERKIPPAVAALLRLLVAGKVSGDDVRWALKRRPLAL